MASRRSALLIRCTQEEADRIRRAAKLERRTLSGYVLNAVMTRVETRERLMTTFQENALPRRKTENGRP
jgi:uncharacterized protein (DUF1778 family)